MTPARVEANPARPASVIALLAGLWLFVSPWVYGVYMAQNAWNNWICGVLIFIFAAVRLSRPGAIPLGWLNTLLGIWVFASPWIYGYTGEQGRFINSLCVGVIVFCASLISLHSMTHRTAMPTPHMT